MTKIRITYPGDDDPSEVIDYQSEAAQRLADVMSIKFDLDFTIAALENLVSSFESGQVETEVNDELGVTRRSLWNSAVVMYARCFDKGVRTYWLHDDQVPGEHADHHKYVRLLRSKYIAHPVNAFEEAFVGIAVGRTSEGSLFVRGIAPTHRGQGTEEIEVIKLTLQLAVAVQQVVDVAMREFVGVVTTEANSLTPDELERLKPMVFDEIDRSKVARSRQRTPPPSISDDAT